MPGRLMIDDKMQKRIRRWFGWDMTLAMLFVFIALYFVWPLMFRKQDYYVTETAVNDGYTLMTHLREHTAFLEGKSENEILQSLKEHPALQPVQEEKVPRIFFFNSFGSLQASNSDLPDYWDEVATKTLTNVRDVFVFKNDEISSILFVDQLPNTQLKIVVVVPFKSMFSSE